MYRVSEPVNGLCPAVFLSLKCTPCNYTAAACARSHELSTMADNQKTAGSPCNLTGLGLQG